MVVTVHCIPLIGLHPPACLQNTPEFRTVKAAFLILIVDEALPTLNPHAVHQRLHGLLARNHPFVLSPFKEVPDVPAL